MRCDSAGQNRAVASRQARPSGFSMIELVVTMSIILVVTSIAIPMIGNAMSGYRLKEAVVSVTGAIQATRYRAIAKRQLGAACATGIIPPDQDEMSATLSDWLNEIERIQLLLRLSPRLRQKHDD